MTGTGVAHTSEGAVCSHLIKPKMTGDLRLREIQTRMLAFTPADTDLVVIEGFLNHSHSAGITGMVHGAVRAALIEQGIKYATLPPSSLKKYATGRGNATKTDMAIAALKRADAEFANDNECDAWWLWVAANDYLEQPVFSLPAAQRGALDALKIEN